MKLRFENAVFPTLALRPTASRSPGVRIPPKKFPRNEIFFFFVHASTLKYCGAERTMRVAEWELGKKQFVKTLVFLTKKHEFSRNFFFLSGSSGSSPSKISTNDKHVTSMNTTLTTPSPCRRPRHPRRRHPVHHFRTPNPFFTSRTTMP